MTSIDSSGEFPDARRLLGILVRQESYTSNGMEAKAQMMRDFVVRWGLGDVRLIPCPRGGTTGEQASIVVIDVGHQRGDELMLGLGHLDTAGVAGYDQIGRDPCALTDVPGRPDLVYGRGTVDMQAGLVAFLLALKDILPKMRKRIKLVIVPYEEEVSQGTRKAVELGLADGADFLLTTDMSGGVQPDDPPVLFVACEGRVGLQWKKSGPPSHPAKPLPGGVSLAKMTGAVLAQAENFSIPQAKSDFIALPEPRVVLPHWGSRIQQGEGASLPTGSEVHLDVYYTHPGLSPAHIQQLLRMHLEGVLRTTDFELEFEERYGHLPNPPWIGDVRQPFYERARRHASAAYHQEVSLAGSRGAADHTIVLQYRPAMPGAELSTQGAGEHTPDERGRISSIDNVARFITAMATDEQPLGRAM